MLSRHLKAQQQVLCGGLRSRHSAEEEQEAGQLMLTHAHTRHCSSRQGIHRTYSAWPGTPPLSSLAAPQCCRRNCLCSRCTSCSCSRFQLGDWRLLQSLQLQLVQGPGQRRWSSGTRNDFGSERCLAEMPLRSHFKCKPLGRCCRPHPGLFTSRLLLPTSPTQGAKPKGCFYTRH